MIDPPVSSSWEPVTLPGVRKCRLESDASGALYDLWLWRPRTVAPRNGFPGIVVLDADDHFVSVVEALQRACRRPESTGIAPAVVIGVNQVCDGSARNAERRRDYTAGPSADEPIAGSAGGAEAFLDVLRQRVLPRVGAEVRLHPEQLGLVGHSMAGYFCLWTALTHPRAFSRYAAISPSLWWDASRLLAGARELVVAEPSPRVYLAAGEWEGPPAPWQKRLVGDAAGLARRQQRRMLEHLRALTGALDDRLPEGAVRFDVLPGEDHGSVVAPAIPRILRFMTSVGSGSISPVCTGTAAGTMPRST